MLISTITIKILLRWCKWVIRCIWGTTHRCTSSSSSFTLVGGISITSSNNSISNLLQLMNRLLAPLPLTRWNRCIKLVANKLSRTSSSSSRVKTQAKEKAVDMTQCRCRCSFNISRWWCSRCTWTKTKHLSSKKYSLTALSLQDPSMVSLEGSSY